MKISVVLCVYNGGFFIEEQLLSLLSQTKQPDEIIIYDDFSHDDSLDRIYSLLSKTSFNGIEIVVIKNKENTGVRMAFNSALKLATGDIIFFCDQDDIWYNNKIQIYYSMFRDFNVDFVIGNADLIDEFGKSLNKTLWKEKGYDIPDDKLIHNTDDRVKLLKYNMFTGMATAISKDLVDAVGVPSTEVMHDSWYIPAAICMGKPGGLIQEPLTAYRQHSLQLFGVGVVEQVTKEVFLRSLNSSERQLRNLLPLCFSDKIDEPYERYILGRLLFIGARKRFYQKSKIRFRFFIIINWNSYRKYFNMNAAISDFLLR